MMQDQIARAMAMDAANSSGSEGGTTNYFQLTNKPKINGVELSGNKTADDLSLASASGMEAVKEQAALHDAALRHVVNAGQKNFLNVSRVTEVTSHNVKLTNNGDGTLTLSGSSDHSNSFMILYNINEAVTSSSGQAAGHSLPSPGNYVVYTGSDHPGFAIQVYGSDDTNTGNFKLLSASVGTMSAFTMDKDYKYIWFRLYISSDAKFGDGVTFRPMICKKEFFEISPDFQPYAMNNAELTAIVSDLKARITALGGNSVTAGVFSPDVMSEEMPKDELMKESTTNKNTAEENTDERTEDI